MTLGSWEPWKNKTDEDTRYKEWVHQTVVLWTHSSGFGLRAKTNFFDLNFGQKCKNTAKHCMLWAKWKNNIFGLCKSEIFDILDFGVLSSIWPGHGIKDSQVWPFSAILPLFRLFNWFLRLDHVVWFVRVGRKSFLVQLLSGVALSQALMLCSYSDVIDELGLLLLEKDLSPHFWAGSRNWAYRSKMLAVTLFPDSAIELVLHHLWWKMCHPSSALV